MEHLSAFMMMSRTQTLARIGAAAAAFPLLLACSEPERPAAVTVSPGTITMDAIGDTKQLTAKATDKDGKELTDAIFTWASSAASVVGVDSSGQVSALAPGTSDVTATAGGVSGTAKVTVAQVISKVEAASGAQQTGTVGQGLPQQLVVRVRDRLDNAVPGAAVTLTVSPNGGTVAPASGTTGADGQLSASWTLGTTAGSFQLTASVAGAVPVAVFNAKANPGPANNLAKASGDNQFGFRSTRLAQLVAVRVRDQYGNGVPNHAVQFTVPSGDGAADSAIAFTDTSGVARSGWVMPSTTGVDTVSLQAASLSGAGSPLLGSPVTFTAVAHNVRVTSVSPTTLPEGQSATLTGSGFDAGNTQNVVTIDGVAAAVTAATAKDLTVTVPGYDCKPARSVAVQVTVGGIPAAAITAPLRPAAAALSLSVGQQTIVTDPAQFCFQLGAQATQEAYLLGVLSTSEVASNLTPISLVGTAATAASAAPALAPRSAPARQGQALPPQTAERLERWRQYREAEVRQRTVDRQIYAHVLASGARAAPRAAAPAAIVPDTAKVGDTLQVRVRSEGAGCTDFVTVTTVVRAKGSTGFFLEDVGNPALYPAGQFTTFSQQYEAKTSPVNAAEFGAPTDRDGNGRVVVVVTKEVNKRGSLGFTTGCDLGTRATYPSSNEGEFFYIASPDPSGTYHPQKRTYSVQQATLDFPDVIAHESVHVIQFGRRQAAGAAQFLDLWAAEGQAVLGEEVVGHSVEGRQTGQNYGFGIVANLDDTTSTDWYFGAFAALGFYFGWAPTNANPNGRVANAPWECTWLSDDSGGPCVGGLEVYGPPWSLFRYMNDRFGPTYTGGEAGIQKAIIEHPQTGYAMLQSVIGVRVDTLLAQWAAMLYLDDITDAWPTQSPVLSLTSWNLDDVYYGTYPLGGFVYSMYTSSRLTPVPLAYETFSESASVRAASTYYAILAGANRPAMAVKARDASGGGILPSSLRYWIVRIQ